MTSTNILNCTLSDLPMIMDLYDKATALMHLKGPVSWPKFSESFVREEVVQGKHWKLLIDGEVACIWAIMTSDPLIWEEKNADPSIYIHRIATHPDFRGKGLVSKLVDWSKTHAISERKKFIRMDTIGMNPTLINHYKKCGFDFLGIKPLANTEGLPAHYKEGDVCLFEIQL